MILDQADRDDAVRDLLKKLSEVYTFMNQDGRLADIQIMQEVFGKLAQQSLECADFIVHYSEAKSACESNALRRCHHMTFNLTHREKTCQERVERNWFHDSEL
jgi:hypothetical protein